MTEYWKSQARKYCEFCKCWFADNKVSISFHENGKKHKESVQKHISHLSKKSAKDFKQKEKIDGEMKKMEAAAMAAYLKDVQNNADLTSQCINEMIGQSNSSVISQNTNLIKTNDVKPKLDLIWHEIKNDDGSSYFWNTQTNETTWDPPDEYLSIEQQEKNKLNKKNEEKKKKNEEKQKQKEKIKEAKAFMAREKMKELSVAEETPPVKYKSFGPELKAANPLGSWKPVIKEPEKVIDLQLPIPDKEAPPPPIVMEPEVVQFKEKRIQSLGDGPVDFKKRKINNPKRNIRQKFDDD